MEQGPRCAFNPGVYLPFELQLTSYWTCSDLFQRRQSQRVKISPKIFIVFSPGTGLSMDSINFYHSEKLDNFVSQNNFLGTFL